MVGERLRTDVRKVTVTVWYTGRYLGHLQAIPISNIAVDERKAMRINILQHTPNEGPGMIMDWAHQHQHAVYTYHPY